MTRFDRVRRGGDKDPLWVCVAGDPNLERCGRTSLQYNGAMFLLYLGN